MTEPSGPTRPAPSPQDQEPRLDDPSVKRGGKPGDPTQGDPGGPDSRGGHDQDFGRGAD